MAIGTPPAPEWRAAQHRVRNDLQTIGALWRLARRRASSDELVEELPSWLNAIAAVYDSVPVWHTDDCVAVQDLVAAIRARCVLSGEFEFEYVGQTCLPAQMAVVGALAVSDLLSFCASSSVPGSAVKVVVTPDNDMTRIEATFASSPTPAAWPPLGLSLAAEAAGAKYTTCRDGGLLQAILVMPCH